MNSTIFLSIPLSLFFILYPLVPSSIFTSTRELDVKNFLACPCHPNYAGEDKYVCKTNPPDPPQSVVIGCDDGGNAECNDLCYEWETVSGTPLPQSEKMKKNPTVSPIETTTYRVKVTNTLSGANLGTSEMTVYVAELEMIAYKPRVIAGNTTTPASPVLGAQTFENIDNDDNDTNFDISDDEVTGGDDELIRVQIKVSPVDLPIQIARLDAILGSANIRVWRDETKVLGPYTLNSDIVLTPNAANTHLTADLWVEGRMPHTVQRGTVLDARYQGCGKKAALTIIGVDQVNWLGSGSNSINNNNALDDDPNFLPPNPVPGNWPTARRIFPDARPATGYGNPLRSAILDVRLTVNPVENINMHIKCFDVDDPSNDCPQSPNGLGMNLNFMNFIDPNDNAAMPNGVYAGGAGLVFTQHSDNRVGDAPKEGMLEDQQGDGTAILAFTPATNRSAIMIIRLSMHPGDNYRAVVNGDRDFLNNLENIDHRDKHKIVDRFTELPDMTRREILFPLKYASPVLTIWRFLHVEYDSMRNLNEYDDNSVLKTFNDFESPIMTSQNITVLRGANQDIRIYQTPNGGPYLDGSPNTNTMPAACTADGRFQNGTVKTVNAVPIMAATLSNNENDLSVNGLNLNGTRCSLRRTIGGINVTATATLVTITRNADNNYLWELNGLAAPVGFTLESFIGGEIRIGIPWLNITGANNANQTINTNNMGITVQILDDDFKEADNLLPFQGSTDGLISAFTDTYIYPVVPLPASQNNLVFDAYLGDVPNETNNLLNNNNTSLANETPSYWAAYVVSCWQWVYPFDFDPNIQTYNFPDCPVVDPVNTEGPIFFGLTPNIQSQNSILATGSHFSIFYRETCRDAGCLPASTIAHEIGHQFGLGHGGNEEPDGPIPEFPAMGLMSPAQDPAPADQFFFIPRQKNLLRSRTNSPGL